MVKILLYMRLAMFLLVMNTKNNGLAHIFLTPNRMVKMNLEPAGGTVCKLLGSQGLSFYK